MKSCRVCDCNIFVVSCLLPTSVATLAVGDITYFYPLSQLHFTRLQGAVELTPPPGYNTIHAQRYLLARNFHFGIAKCPGAYLSDTWISFHCTYSSVFYSLSERFLPLTFLFLPLLLSNIYLIVNLFSLTVN